MGISRGVEFLEFFLEGGSNYEAGAEGGGVGGVSGLGWGSDALEGFGLGYFLGLPSRLFSTLLTTSAEISTAGTEATSPSFGSSPSI